jgi:hypothetical protein
MVFYTQKLEEGESHLFIHNKDPIYRSTSLWVVNETFFKEYFFPLDERILNVYFDGRDTTLNINIKSQNLLDELSLKDYAKNISDN